jgi:hypothetical protein
LTGIATPPASSEEEDNRRSGVAGFPVSGFENIQMQIALVGFFIDFEFRILERFPAGLGGVGFLFLFLFCCPEGRRRLEARELRCGCEGTSDERDCETEIHAAEIPSVKLETGCLISHWMTFYSK